ncbi:MAG: hypothetical protein LC785_05970 [Acidobacteria bacterium]|nr:hypothetical protein [Acidobacteriota bacterium]MCA1641492.1 hypothetical protein [Acidobacteriota bacterium]
MGRMGRVNVARMKVFFDIETAPPDESEREKVLADVEREMGEKKPQPAAAQIEKVADERFRQLALCGEQGRILVIGMIVEREGEVVKRCLIGCEASRQFHLDEARTLRSFWASLADFDCRRDLIVGHNIFDFDLLFIYKRSAIHEVRPTVNFPSARYRSQPVFDTMREWEFWGRGRVGLGRLAEALRLESSKNGGVNGANVYDNFIAGRHEEIGDYCGRDVELVRAVYYRMRYLDMPISK